MLENQKQVKIAKSRAAINQAFRKLILQRPYSEIHVPDIANNADVARSTFYKHFRSKDDLLRSSLSGVVSQIAEAGFEADSAAKLERLLAHFVEVESLCKSCLSFPIVEVVIEMLANKICERIENDLMLRPNTPFSVTLLSKQIAGSSIGLISWWIHDINRVEISQVAFQLHTSSKALLDLLVLDPGKPLD